LKQQLVSKQLSKRGGVIYVAPHHNKVLIAGAAVTALQGELNN